MVLWAGVRGEVGVAAGGGEEAGGGHEERGAARIVQLWAHVKGVLWQGGEQRVLPACAVERQLQRPA